MIKMLKGSNISKSIAGKKILSEVEIEIQPGKIAALIGPSGGGKSSLIRNLSLLEKPDSGCVAIDKNEYHFPFMQKVLLPRNIHPSVSVVFQQFHLWPHLSVMDNILMPLRQKRTGFDLSKFNDLIYYFEIGHLMTRFPNELSVGQKQRIAFIRAVLLRPKYLLLDEITSALDIKHIGKMLQFIKQLAGEGVGILIATHLIGFAVNAADQIFFLNEGSVVEAGDSGILKNPQTEPLTKFLTYLEYGN